MISKPQIPYIQAFEACFLSVHRSEISITHKQNYVNKMIFCVYVAKLKYTVFCTLP